MEWSIQRFARNSLENLQENRMENIPKTKLRYFNAAYVKRFYGTSRQGYKWNTQER